MYTVMVFFSAGVWMILKKDMDAECVFKKVFIHAISYLHLAPLSIKHMKTIDLWILKLFFLGILL